MENPSGLETDLFLRLPRTPTLSPCIRPRGRKLDVSAGGNWRGVRCLISWRRGTGCLLLGLPQPYRLLFPYQLACLHSTVDVALTVFLSFRAPTDEQGGRPGRKSPIPAYQGQKGPGARIR